MNPSMEEYLVGMLVLGITVDDIRWVREANTESEAEKRLRLVQGISKKNYRRAAARLHPDKTNNDPDAAELFQIVKELNNRIQNARIRPVSGSKAVFLVDWLCEVVYPGRRHRG